MARRNPAARGWRCSQSAGCAILAVLGVLFYGGLTRAASFHSLRKEWQADLGPIRQRFHLYRAGICSAGSVFFTDGQGRLGIIGQDGVLTADRILPALIGAKSIACDEKGRALVGVSTPEGSHLIAIENAGRTFQLKWKSADLRAPIFAVEASPAATYVLAPVRLPSGELRFLHRLNLDGAITTSFGVMPFHIAPALALQAITEGSLSWSSATKQLLFVSSGSPEFQFYSPFGSLDEVRQRIDSDFFPADPLPSFSHVFRRDSLLRVVALPGGDFVVFVNKQRDSGSRSFLEIVRPAPQGLSVIDTGVSISGDGGYGFLVGADREGALYFARGNPSLGGTLIKARLLQQ